MVKACCSVLYMEELVSIRETCASDLETTLITWAIAQKLLPMRCELRQRLVGADVVLGKLWLFKSGRRIYQCARLSIPRRRMQEH